MLKVEITSARVRTRGRFMTTGSALAGTIEGSCIDMDMNVDVESPADRSVVVHVIRQAEAGCYAMQALRQPTDVAVTMTLNGKPVEL
jgi:hypothetical protein